MDERPRRRRDLTPEEKRNLDRQQLKEREFELRQAKREAKLREQARRDARRRGEDSHIVVEIPAKPEKRPKPPKRSRKKTLPDMIEKETDRRVRDLEPTDHRDGGYYVNEVGVRRRTAEKQRVKRKKARPKPISPKQRRVRRIIAYMSIILVVIIVGIVLSLTVLFKTEKIEVKGNKYYDEKVIVQLSGLKEGDNIFTSTMFANTDKIVETLPYIKSASVGFNIPNGLVITVENQAPYYSLKSGSDYFLVSKDNRILEKVDKKPDKLMFIEAPKLKSTEAGDYVEFEKERYTKALEAIIASLKKNNIKDITAISVKDINNITITYDNRIVIKIGLPDDIDYKIRTAFTIINKNLDPHNTKTIMGILNVSNCNTGSKKSYFEEVEIKETTEPTKATEKPKKKKKKATEATSEPETEETTPEEFPTEAYEESYTEPVTFYDDLYGYYGIEESIQHYGGGDSNEGYDQGYDHGDGNTEGVDYNYE
ncbi:MAG: FtsQ-type POTRA domain-containing protein [Ruminococcus sp.]|nr:FtsQ-type POTRA domain-containing protein [Ruminococcus sp.]